MLECRDETTSGPLPLPGTERAKAAESRMVWDGDDSEGDRGRQRRVA